ncbi:MAG: hypothetical protein FJ304_22245, partial [Planctomycetes bacterium]|nr:hypothetical protein [Planctomycetota bacterium]
MTDAPIPWPRCQPRGAQGGSGLWVNDTLVRAIRTESAQALAHWFGVDSTVVWRWRTAFGVSGRAATTRGTKALVRAAAKKGAAALKAKVWTTAERAAKRRIAKKLKLRPNPRWQPGQGAWSAAEVAALGTDSDAAVAKALGRTTRAVAAQRGLRGIPAHSGWPGGGPAWRADELALLGTDTDAAVAARIGRTPSAVSQKRLALRVRARRATLAPNKPQGDFPTYNLGAKTAEGGEFRAGASVPLLRDRAIDRPRANLQQA